MPPPPSSSSEGFANRPPDALSRASLQNTDLSPSPHSFRQSMSPYMKSIPSTPPTGFKSAANTSSTPTASWAPPKTHTFVNGRGNVQLAATPRDFVPPSSSYSKDSTSPGSTTPLMENRGQRTYLRSSPPALDPSGKVDGVVVFPSAFGVKQRINVTNRRGSMVAPSAVGSGPEFSTGRQSPPRSSTLGTPRAAQPSSELEYHSRRVPEATPLPALSNSPLASAKSSNSNKSYRSEHSEPIVETSRLNAQESDTSDDENDYESGREEVDAEDEGEEESKAVKVVSGVNEHAETGSSEKENEDFSWGSKQSPAAVPTSIMSGSGIESPAITNPGRAGLLDSESQGPTSTTAPATPYISYRPRSSRPDSFAKISPYQPKSPTLFAPDSPKTPSLPLSSSIMNRSRPRTPAFYPSSEDEEQASSSTNPLAAATYIKGHFASSSVSSSTSTHFLPPRSPDLGSRSILDRPRPRTPDPQSWLDSPETSSSSFTYLHTRGSPSLSSGTSFSKSSPSLLASSPTPQVLPQALPPALPQAPIVLRPEISSWHARMPSIVVPLNRTERRESMKPSPDHTLLNGRLEDGAGESSFAEFESSSAFRRNNLSFFSESPKLDLDLGFSPNAVEGSMLDLDGLLRSGETVSPAKSTFSPLAPLPSTGVITPMKQLVEERKDWRRTSRLSMDSQQSKEPMPRSLPRKEPPKVDLKLELELEIDAAIRETRSISSEEEVGSSLSTSLYNPATSPGFSPISPSLSRGVPQSISESESHDHSPTAPDGFSPASDLSSKRRHRKSFSSLFSLASPTISSQSAFLDEDEGSSPKTHARKGSHSRFLSSSAPAEGFFSLLKPADKSLPPTPTDSSFQSSTTYQPTNFSEAPKASGSSLLGRQLSRIRSRPDPSIPSSAGSSFNVPRKSHKGPSASISSTQSMLGSTSNQIGRLVNRFRSKAGSQTSSENAGTSSPSSTTSAARYRNDQRDEKRSLSSKTGAFLLGMSLAGARKSEDLLARPVEESNSEISIAEKNLGGRRSFDLLTQAKTVERRPSTDNLLTLATAQLSGLKANKPSELKADTTQSALSLQDSTPSYVPSSPTSISSDSSENEHGPETAAVTVATRIVRSRSASADGVPSVPSPLVLRSDQIGRREAFDPADSPSPSTGWKKRAKAVDSGMGSDASMSSAWLDVEDALASYNEAVEYDHSDRGNIVVNKLLPFLKHEEETCVTPMSHYILVDRYRQILFAWLATLTMELREMQPLHRGACLDAVAAITESRFLTASALQGDLPVEDRYRAAIVEILAFAVDKLNEKAVYANTLVFAGRIFALAFWRIEGVAIKLLKALPSVKKHSLTRILGEAGIPEGQLPPVYPDLFPSHLKSLCLFDLPSYTTLLLPRQPHIRTEDDGFLVRDQFNEVEMAGNWLIRFTASDSDLPFAFYRAYHRQLARHLLPLRSRSSSDNKCTSASPYTAPGFLFLSASLLEKLDALVHRNLRSVTSTGPNNGNFNTNESANLSFATKPKSLELANRRLVSTLLDIVGGPPPSSDEDIEHNNDSECQRSAFGPVLQVWIRACVKKTSLWDTRSVFILLDLLEGLLYTLSYPAPSNSLSANEAAVSRPQESSLAIFDIPFLFSVVQIILQSADNTIALMRTLSFLYAHFEIFTLRAEDRTELCENILLEEGLFSRLYLHWNAGVRGYYVRLLVWRLARIGIVAAEQRPTSARDPRILALFTLLNFRLETIRRRHDELEPLDTLTDDDLFKPKRSTICSTRGVKEAPYAVNEFSIQLPEESDDERAGDVEGRENLSELPQEILRNPTEVKKSSTSRLVSFLKGGLGKAKSGGKVLPAARIEPFVISASPSTQEALSSTYSAELIPENPSIDTESFVEETSTRPASPAFFSFEFEGSLSPRANFDRSSVISSQSADTIFPTSPLRRNIDPLHHGAASPRVSLRFSKRISILPPAALDLFRESSVDVVPPIPAQYMTSTPQAYPERLHPYAVRGLREYEDALDEWQEWISRLQEEVDEGKEANRTHGTDVVPSLRIGWSWPDDQ